MFWHKAKKKTSLFPVAGLKITMRNAFFFFFFYNSWKSNEQCGFYFFKQNFRKKIHQNNSLGFFSTFIKNITSFISAHIKMIMWPFILHALGASLMNFLPWPKLHHIWKKIQSKCTDVLFGQYPRRTLQIPNCSVRPSWFYRKQWKMSTVPRLCSTTMALVNRHVI